MQGLGDRVLISQRRWQELCRDLWLKGATCYVHCPAIAIVISTHVLQAGGSAAQQLWWGWWFCGCDDVIHLVGWVMQCLPIACSTPAPTTPEPTGKWQAHCGTREGRWAVSILNEDVIRRTRHCQPSAIPTTRREELETHRILVPCSTSIPSSWECGPLRSGAARRCLSIIARILVKV